jgi:hypothetical protein
MYGLDMMHIRHIRLCVDKEEGTVEKCNSIIFDVVKNNLPIICTRAENNNIAEIATAHIDIFMHGSVKLVGDTSAC